jgi:hypothetical protein
VRTDHGDAATARAVAAAVRPDNTAEMETRTEGATVVTTLCRETTGGLHSTVDDYVVNLGVAARLSAQSGDRPGEVAATGRSDDRSGTDGASEADRRTATDTDRDTDTNTDT